MEQIFNLFGHGIFLIDTHQCVKITGLIWGIHKPHGTVEGLEF